MWTFADAKVTGECDSKARFYTNAEPKNSNSFQSVLFAFDKAEGFISAVLLYSAVEYSVKFFFLQKG